MFSLRRKIKINWRSDGQDYTTTFEELKIGMTFFIDDDPYLKISEDYAFNIDENIQSYFQQNYPVEPCTHELILRH